MNNSKKRLFIVVTLIFSLVAMVGCGNSNTALSINSAKGAGSVSYSTQMPNAFFNIFGGNAQSYVKYVNDEMNSIDSMKASVGSVDGNFTTINYNVSFDSLEEYNTIMYTLTQTGHMTFREIMEASLIPTLQKFAAKKKNVKDFSLKQKAVDIIIANLRKDFSYEPATICKDNEDNPNELSLIVPSYHAYGVYVWNACAALIFAGDNTDVAGKNLEKIMTSFEYLFNDTDFEDKDIFDEDASDVLEDKTDKAKKEFDEIKDSCTKADVNKAGEENYEDLQKDLDKIDDKSAQGTIADAKAITAILADMSLEDINEKPVNTSDVATKEVTKTTKDTNEVAKDDAKQAASKDTSDVSKQTIQNQATDSTTSDVNTTTQDNQATKQDENNTSTNDTTKTTQEIKQEEAPAPQAAPEKEFEFDKVNFNEPVFTDVDWNQGLFQKSNVTFDMSFGTAKLEKTNLFSKTVPEYFVLSTTFKGLVKTNDGKDKDTSPKTGDSAPIAIVSSIAILSLGVLVVCKKKSVCR